MKSIDSHKTPQKELGDSEDLRREKHQNSKEARLWHAKKHQYGIRPPFFSKEKLGKGGEYAILCTRGRIIPVSRIEQLHDLWFCLTSTSRLVAGGRHEQSDDPALWRSFTDEADA